MAVFVSIIVISTCPQNGKRGIQGNNGPQGQTGFPGKSSGLTGRTGPDGDVGIQGRGGDFGDNGPMGQQGPKNPNVGSTGAMGYEGEQGDALPVGSIVCWITSRSIPTGWVVCDGTDNKTPNLVNSFIKGDMNENQRTGSISYTLEKRHLPKHKHKYMGGVAGDLNEGSNFNGRYTSASTNTSNTGAIASLIESYSVMPRYYRLVYIMKVLTK